MSNERFTVPEILFHPLDIGVRQMGISEAIVAAVNNCPLETRPYLFENIVLSGGNMKFPGVKERVKADVRSQVPEEYDISVFLSDE